LIVRTHAYGWAPPGAAPDFAEAAFEALQTGQPLAVDSHRYATPLLASDLAELLWKAMAADLAGVIHLAGAERTSLRRFVHVLAAELSITPVACHEACGEQLQPAATETSLVAILARDRLKTPMPTLREGLGRFVRQRYDGYYDKLHAGSRAHAHAA
jgi:dTDP-4-dehydrorhamnose reductase